MSRGMLTEEIENKSNELFGYKFNQRELRLLPYVQYCVLNNMNISPDKVNGEERLILQKWTQLGFLKARQLNFKFQKSSGMV